MIGILPLNPHKISVIVPLIASKCISEIMNEETIFSNNSLGFNSGYTGSELEAELKYWGVNFNTEFKDVEIYQELASTIEQDKLTVKKEAIFTCECSRLELPVNHINADQGNYKLLVNNQCQICKTIIKTESINLYYLLDEPLDNLHLYPENTTSQYKHFAKSLSDNQYLKISKLRDTGLFINFDNEKFFIDIDFVHLLYLDYLTQKGVDKIVLSRKSLYFLAKCSFFNKNKCDVFLLTYLNNFNSIYAEIKTKFNSFWQIFLLTVIDNSKKNISTDVLLNDINTISKIDGMRIEKYFKENFKSSEEMDKGFNRNILEKL